MRQASHSWPWALAARVTPHAQDLITARSAQAPPHLAICPAVVMTLTKEKRKTAGLKNLQPATLVSEHPSFATHECAQLPGGAVRR